MKLTQEVWNSWRTSMEKIRDDVQLVVNDRAVFRGFRKIVEANGEWIDENEGGLWIDFVKRSYAAAAFVGIRRQIKNDPQSVSLKRLLNQIAKCAEQLTYAYYLEMHPRADEVARLWQRPTFATLSEDGHVVTRSLVEQDLSALARLNEHIETVTDRTVVHLDKRGTTETVSFDDLADSIDQLNGLTCKYVLFLTGVQYNSLEASVLFPWDRILKLPLVRPV